MRISPLHALWRRIPRPVRSGVFNFCTSALAPHACPLEQTRPGAVTVAGLFSVSSGLGHGARRLLKGLRESDIDAQAFDLGPAFRQSDIAWRACQSTSGSGPLIVHINGPHLPYALLRIPSKLRAKRYVIGYWNWELPVVPHEWRIAEKHVHEIWTPSQFTAQALRARIELPVHVVPYPFGVTPPAPRQRSDIGVPENAFLVFNSFNAGSGYSRKNPDALVDAFIQAFADHRDAYLLIKIGNPDLARSQIDRLRERIDKHNNISILTGAYSDTEALQLVMMSDAVVSLHRSEGFGFLMVEAMHLGRPVVATNWSGNVDFLSDRNSWPVSYALASCFDPQGTYNLEEAAWAEPDVKQAAEHLLEIYRDPDSARHKAGIAQQDIVDYTSINRFKAALPQSFLEHCQPNST